MTSETFALTTALTEQRERTGDRETRIAVIGSTGRTGKLVLAEGLRRGYALTAFTRRPAELAGIDGLSAVVEGDGRRSDDVRRAVQGPDASEVRPGGRISLMDPTASHAPIWRRPSSISRRIPGTFGTFSW